MGISQTATPINFRVNSPNPRTVPAGKVWIVEYSYWGSGTLPTPTMYIQGVAIRAGGTNISGTFVLTAGVTISTNSNAVVELTGWELDQS